MKDLTLTPDLSPEMLATAADHAARAVPPLWPLASSVAVNPYLGQTGESLAQAGARLGRVAGAAVTMPRAWFRQRVADGIIGDEDLAAALAAAGTRRLHSLATLRAQLDAAPMPPVALATVADLAAKASGVDWPGVLADRIGAWAAGYFDAGQALWSAPRGGGAYAAWRAVATHDLTPEIIGLSGFAAHIAAAPDTAPAAIARVARTLRLSEAALGTYFHQMLTSLGGWGQVARHALWQAERFGTQDATCTDLLAIRLLWEEALYLAYPDRIGDAWRGVVAAHAAPLSVTDDLAVDAILQDAAERAMQRDLARKLSVPGQARPQDRPALQAAFCIDVRSEVFRRALHAASPGIETLGFAGFFGLTAAHRRFASDVEELRLPVLLAPGLHSHAGDPAGDAVATRISARATRAWGRFKRAAVSSFAFVEATGPVHVPALLGAALGRGAAEAPADPAPQLDPAPDLPQRLRAAESVLRAMSLTSGFARLVLLAGHGAGVTNNPQASGLQCGACGGYSGEVNARLLAALLNDPETRAGLGGCGIVIPPDTLFLAALHDTTTDAVTLYTADHPAPDHGPDIDRARGWLAAAAMTARAERAGRLPRATNPETLVRRGRDWAETRPEWALAGCAAFIAAPRMHMAGRDFAGRAFLHDYDHRLDAGFGVLELILTAPVVVASWISLQYYGSTVDPQTFGAGNKLLHNVTGGIGVVEGNGGVLRSGLPWQSVHDGAGLAHEPLRLSVCIAAPTDAMDAILHRHPDVRALFDNRWLHLFALDDDDRMARRYAGELTWTDLAPAAG